MRCDTLSNDMSCAASRRQEETSANLGAHAAGGVDEQQMLGRALVP